MAKRKIPYERMCGVDASHGQKFEMDMTTLVYLRCQRLHEKWKRDGTSGIKSFAVANNVKGAGKFDDIVVRVEYVAEGLVKNKLIFVQCKHLQNPSENFKKKFKLYLSDRETLKNYVQSYEMIEDSRRNEIKERFSIKTSDSEQNICARADKEHSNLKNFFDCENLEIELVFYSNLSNDTDCILYKIRERNGNQSDPTYDIFNTTQSEQCELKLNENLLPVSIFKNQNTISTESKKQFCGKFRVFVLQSEPETFLSEEMKLLNNKIVDVENLRDLLVQEVRCNFVTQTRCNALTEENDLLQNVHNYWDIRRKGIEDCDAFRNNVHISNLFSSKTIQNFIQRLDTEKNIVIDTNFPKLEKLKILQIAHTTSDETTFIYINDKDDKIKWISSRKTKAYKKLSRIIIYSKYVVNLGTQTLLPNEFLIQFRECSEQKLTLAEYVEQFSSETEQYICNKKICFQGESTDVISSCGDSWKMVFDEIKICKILENNLIEIGKPFPTLDFYVARKFRIEDFSVIFHKLTKICWKRKGNYLILFSEGNECLPGHKSTCKVFRNMTEVRGFVENCAEKRNQCYHLCSRNNGQIELIYSFGKASHFTREYIIGEDALTNENISKILILSDVAGMGKTTTLLYLAKKYKEKNPSHWVFFIELNKYLHLLNEIDKFQSTKSAIDFIGSTLLNLKATELMLFSIACKESGNSALFFDAFDEISPDAEKSFSLLLLVLERTKIKKIVVSSRPNYTPSLEKKLLIKSIKFQGLTNKKKELALAGYWNQLLKKDEKKIEDDLLRVAANKTVTLLQFLHEILAIPLQIRMVAIIYYDFLLTINSEERVTHSSSLNLATLYEQFMILQAERYYVEKHKLEWNKVKIDQKERFIQEKLKGAEEIACQLVIPDLLKNDIIDRMKKISALCDDVGIITNKSPVVFLHRTVAEYLAAKYIVTEMFCKNNSDDTRIVIYILVNKKFNIVRKFINSLLIGTTVDIFGQYQTKEIKIIGDISWKTPIYVAATEGNLEIVRLIARNIAFLNMKNSRGMTALRQAYKNGQTEVLNLLLSHKGCSDDSCDNNGDIVLHIASRRSEIEIMQLILQCDSYPVNTRNKERSTPLHEACFGRRTKVAKLLLSRSDCSVDIRDDDGDTVLHAASMRDDIEIMKLILQHDRSPLNMQNWDGFTPLHVACCWGKVEAVKYLLAQKDCMVNMLDFSFFRLTALDVARKSRKYGHSEIIELLLQHGGESNESKFTNECLILLVLLLIIPSVLVFFSVLIHIIFGKLPPILHRSLI